MVTDGAYYLGEKEDVSLVGVLADLSAFLVIFSYIVPISLYTTLGNSSVKQLKILDNLLLLCNILEVQKFTSSQFFGWDLKLYCESTDEPAICNTSDLNEELGQVFDFTTLIIKIEIIPVPVILQVQYLFTDKTGTLTENCMQFRQCSIMGNKYIEENDILLKVLDGNSALNLQRITDLTVYNILSIILVLVQIID